MNNSSNNQAYLVLADGTLFEGMAFGYLGNALGEVVFNTGMTGYQEVITDPSYYGQMVAFTYPELGNTGVNSDDQESSHPHVAAVICRELSPRACNWRSQNNLESWLLEHKVVGISGVDTRALVRHLRELGSMNGLISSDGRSPVELLEELKQIPPMEGLNLVDKVTTDIPYKWDSVCSVSFDKRIRKGDVDPFRVVAIDFGIKRSILERLVAHGCEVTVLPACTDIETVLSYQPEGVFLSNGPGDPAAVKSGIFLAQELLNQNDLPVFGICLGHQILGLAIGGRTFKLPYGHRGLNHPCGTTGRVEITSQNHGFALDADSLSSKNVSVTHLNLNDRTVAAIALRDQPVLGVQYHPEASPGPHDADHHFARFVALMKQRR
ncbi:glutamine-hydrolyzing carbamoyl-phosphate synthase small subunit [Prochlorococcus sp. MIT 1300]|uniref:glutamine-hydrolyzing carbamoyl-phosphate synthase small subunit n=1 Tax=Prochlorococcus sp. MIT 1300 TaxID=3096218 RepID=UPI002A75ED69|nr:glutamine-hydrolyzing carbamoyl-phosphate synthase small subunit [Prochlorococcus sp. MIT 1300]